MNSPKIKNLADIVLETLDFSEQNLAPKFKAPEGRYFVVGSVNAFNTGKMLFAETSALFADESNFRKILIAERPAIKSGQIKEAVIISASGEKDSIWEVKEAKKTGLKTTLLTCNANSSAAKLADKTIAFRKIAEPYSYNFSTYLNMLLGKTHEKPQEIKKYLSGLKLPKNFHRYQFFSFVLPDKFQVVSEMINVKDDELFGPYSSLRAYPEGKARHAKFIAESKKELIISFGKNPHFGPRDQRWEIKLPSKADFGFALSLAYYLVGKIQANKPPYFTRGLANYCLKTGPRPYGSKKPFEIIVSGN